MSRLPAFASASCFLRTRACASASSVPASCPIAVDTLSETSVALAWPAAALPGPYRVQYGPTGGTLTSFRSASLPEVTLRNLRPGASYDVRITPGVGNAAFTTVGCAAPTAGAADGAAAADSTVAAEEAPLTELSRLQVLVGRIVECEPHPDADTLYVEKVDCGEEEPRTIVSGLVKYVKKEDLVGRSVLCLANLKPRAMRGVTSHGMLLCASNEDHSEVDPLAAPEGAALGELVTFEGHRSAPIAPGNRASKAFDRIAAELRTDADGTALYKNIKFQTSAGPCFSPAKIQGSVS